MASLSDVRASKFYVVGVGALLLAVGAVIYFLRNVIWTIPGFSVARYRGELAALHERIQAKGSFVSHAQRFLVEVRKPGLAQHQGRRSPALPTSSSIGAEPGERTSGLGWVWVRRSRSHATRPQGTT